MIRATRRGFLTIIAVLFCTAATSGCSVLGLGRNVTISYETAGLVEEAPYEGTEGSSFRLPVPEHEDYDFDGWYYDAEFLQECGKIISLDRSRTLYAKWIKRDADWTFSPVAADTAFKVTSYTGTDAYVRIPSVYAGKPVTVLGARFLGARAAEVHGVMIPDSIAVIEDYAFYNAAYLEEIEIPASVRQLGSRVFAVDAVDMVLRKYVYIDGDPAVEPDTFYDPSMSFQVASVVADPDTAAYRLFLRQNSVNAGVVDATGIAAAPVATQQYGAHLGAGAAHALAYDDLPARPAVNAGMILGNLRFGYASECAEGSTAARVLAQARAALTASVRGEMSEYEKVHAIYDWVTAAVTYDEAVLEEDILASWLDAAYNLEGVFLNRTAVCDGIAKAVELLCRMEGIECVRVFGVSGGGGHAWNKVRLDGAWYLLDATFGDCAGVRAVGASDWTRSYGEFTDHAMMLGADDDYHTPDPPFASGYETAAGARTYFQSVVYGDGCDLELNSTAEVAAFLDEYAPRLALGEVVNFTIGDRPAGFGYSLRDELLAALRRGLFARGMADCRVLESGNGSWFLMPSGARAEAA